MPTCCCASEMSNFIHSCDHRLCKANKEKHQKCTPALIFDELKKRWSQSSLYHISLFLFSAVFKQGSYQHFHFHTVIRVSFCHTVALWHKLQLPECKSRRRNLHLGLIKKGPKVGQDQSVPHTQEVKRMGKLGGSVGRGINCTVLMQWLGLTLLHVSVLIQSLLI